MATHAPARTGAAARLRRAAVGELLPASVLGPRPARRLDAAALLVPGSGSLDAYRLALGAARDDFGAWDGRVAVLDPDGGASHRLVVVDRYGQVYATHDAEQAADLPDAAALEEWFRFLSTACPECGVIDDPRPRDWVP